MNRNVQYLSWLVFVGLLSVRTDLSFQVARRRLRRPPRRSAHLAKNRTHVKLAEAGIDRVVPKVDHDVKVMLDEMEKEDDRDRFLLAETEITEEMEGDDDISSGVKVAG
jgi:hypothetical protein